KERRQRSPTEMPVPTDVPSPTEPAPKRGGVEVPDLAALLQPPRSSGMQSSAAMSDSAGAGPSPTEMPVPTEQPSPSEEDEDGEEMATELATVVPPTAVPGGRRTRGRDERAAPSPTEMPVPTYVPPPTSPGDRDLTETSHTNTMSVPPPTLSAVASSVDLDDVVPQASTRSGTRGAK
ncbi:unnamed protein product, partial [Polarella glacialis]